MILQQRLNFDLGGSVPLEYRAVDMIRGDCAYDVLYCRIGPWVASPGGPECNGVTWLMGRN